MPDKCSVFPIESDLWAKADIHMIESRPCACGGTLHPVAYHTGDGWHLAFECDKTGDCVPEDGMPWIWGDESKTASELEQLGFRVA